MLPVEEDYDELDDYDDDFDDGMMDCGCCSCCGCYCDEPYDRFGNPKEDEDES